MRNALSKGILAATLIAGPTTARADGPATAPVPREVNDQEAKRVAEIETTIRSSLDDARHRQEEAARELMETCRHVQELTGLVEVTPVSVQHVVTRLQEQREELELDGAGSRGRRDALREAVDEVSKQLKDRAQNDAVATTLEKVVEVRRAQLQRLDALYKQAAVARSEVDAAEASLATAEAEVAAAQQKAAGGTAAEPLDAWNRQLLELGVADREREARLAFINKRLGEFAKGMQALNDMEEKRARLTAADNAVTELEQEARQVREAELRRDVRSNDPFHSPPPAR